MFGISAKVTWKWKDRTGDDVLAAAINQQIKAIRNWRPFFRDLIHVVLEPSVVEQFVSQGASGGTPWAPLADSTIARRARMTSTATAGGLGFSEYAGNLDILRRTGRLYESFLGGADHVQQMTNDTLVWGTSVPYAPIHQTGARAPRQGSLFAKDKRGRYRARPRAATGGAIPARPILVMSSKMKAQIDTAIARFTARTARDSGFKVRNVTLGGKQLSFESFLE